MRRLKFDEQMIRLAAKKAQQLGTIKNSITGGAGNVAGYLSEIALSEHLGCSNVSCDPGEYKYDFDLLKNGKKIEVKTKRRTVDPELHYEVSIAEASKHQQTDFYAFISITFSKKTGFGVNSKYYSPQSLWLCGFMSRSEYFKRARFLKKEEIDRSNGFTVKADMFNMPISELLPELPE